MKDSLAERGDPPPAEDPKDLLDAYTTFRNTAAVLQVKLETYFERDPAKYAVYANGDDRDKKSGKRVDGPFASTSEPWTTWHALVDLVAIEVFYLAKPFERLKSEMERRIYHTGLEGSERIETHDERTLVMRELLQECIDAVAGTALKFPVEMSGGSRE